MSFYKSKSRKLKESEEMIFDIEKWVFSIENKNILTTVANSVINKKGSFNIFHWTVLISVKVEERKIYVSTYRECTEL